MDDPFQRFLKFQSPDLLSRRMPGGVCGKDTLQCGTADIELFTQHLQCQAFFEITADKIIHPFFYGFSTGACAGCFLKP